MNTYTFVVNPAAGKGSGAKIAQKLRRLLDARGVTYSVVETEGPGHAVELARNASSSVVVSVGGDGTANEVVNGLAGTSRAMGIVPAGSGNDFIKSIGIPRQLEGALDKCLSGRQILVDIGTVTCANGKGTTRRFLNGVGIGFDAAVAVRTNQIRFLRGTALYMLAVFQTLSKYRNPMMTIALDGTVTRGRHLLIAVGNGVCAGGGFYLTPKARVDDGLLDVCLIGDVHTGRILRLMPLVLWGKHITRTDVVRYATGKQLHVESEAGFYVHADGEIVGESVSSVRIELDGQKLAVLA